MAAVGETLDRYDFCAMCARRRDEARHHGFAIEEDRACATFALGAPFFGSGQHSFFAKQAKQSFIVAIFEDKLFAVDVCLDRCVGEAAFNFRRFSIRFFLFPITIPDRAGNHPVRVYLEWTSNRVK